MFAPHFSYGGGCNNNSDEEETYFVEIGRIPNSAYERHEAKFNTNYLSYAEVKKIRYDLKASVVGDYEYESGVSIDEIHALLQENPGDPLMVKDALQFLEDVGNNIIIFNLKKLPEMTYNPNEYKLYMYIERE